jgi:hypothetical protein
MKRMSLLITLVGCVMLTPVHAQEPWTEIGIYGFMTDIGGEAKVGNVATDVDISFSDILDNLDVGFMGFVEHRRGNWSFIGDAAYLKVSAEKTTSRTSVSSTTLDAEFEQTEAEGFVGYRVFEQDHGDAQFGIDLLGGARYNKFELELDVQASLLGLTKSASRNPSESWVDGVIGVRGEYRHNNGWGASVWADYGYGSDSSSFQLAGIGSYRFKNLIKVFGGYRFLNLEHDGVSRGRVYELDLDYTGPMIGVAYRF